MNLSQLTKKAKEYALAFTVVIVAVVGFTNTTSGQVVGDNFSAFVFTALDIGFDETDEFTIVRETTPAKCGAEFTYEVRIKRPGKTGKGRQVKSTIYQVSGGFLLPPGTSLIATRLSDLCEANTPETSKTKYRFTIVRIHP